MAAAKRQVWTGAAGAPPAGRTRRASLVVSLGIGAADQAPDSPRPRRHLSAFGRIASWTEVTSADLEGFLAGRGRGRHQEIYVLRIYLAWARQRKLLLIDLPARSAWNRSPDSPGRCSAPYPGTLPNRWISDTTHPHERLAGLLALLHAASSAEIRSLTMTGVDNRHRGIMLPGRPFPSRPSSRPGRRSRPARATVTSSRRSTRT
jgi:hypothetical protein